MKPLHHYFQKHRIVTGGLVLLFTFFGCAGPDERGDEELTERDIQQRQRVIEPLDDLPEQQQGQTAPILMEFYVDDEGRIRVDLLPYVITDPGAGPPEETEDVEDEQLEEFDDELPPDE